MDRINFQNNVTKLDKEMFDTFQNNIEKSSVVVSTTQPQTSEKVWVKKSKNKFNKNNYFADPNGYIGFFVNLKYGQTYTISSNLPIIAKFATSGALADTTVGPQNWEKFTSWTFVAGKNSDNFLNNIVYIGVNAQTLSKNIEDFSQCNIQIEQGTTATDYEEYADPMLFTKKNKLFEELFDEISGSAYINVSTSEIKLNNYHKSGKVCTFGVEIKLAQDLNANAFVKIASGLPKEASAVRFIAYYGADKACRLYLNNGTISLWYNTNKIASGEYLDIFITYTTK